MRVSLLRLVRVLPVRGCLLALICCAPALMTPADLFGESSAHEVVLPSELVPGRIFTLDFPHLGKTWHGHDSKMEVYLPEDYQPNRQYPLLVWFGHSVGSHAVLPVAEITGAEGFVCAALPYREVVGKMDRSHSGWKTDWSYYHTMLEGLERAVPNIHPGKRIAGGYSSGGAAILWSIARSQGKFQDYFYAVMPGGAGWSMGGLQSLKGRPVLMFMGENDPRFSEYEKLYRTADATGVQAELIVFKGVGHEFPTHEYKRLRQWMLDRVVRRWVPQAAATIERAMRTDDWDDALPAIQEVLSSADPETTEYAVATQAMQRAGEAGESRLRVLMTANPNVKQLHEFIDTWRDFPASQEAAEACNRLGIEELDALLKSRSSNTEAALRAFLDRWQGFSVYEKALDAYDGLARAELKQIVEFPNKHTRAKKLIAFAKRWSPAPAASDAMTHHEELAAEALGEVVRVEAKPLRARKLKAFTTMWEGTAAAVEAVKLREAVAREILDEILQLPDGSTKRGRLRGFARAYRGTEAARDAELTHSRMR